PGWDDEIGGTVEQRFRIMMPLGDVDELVPRAGHRASKSRQAHAIARRLAVEQRHTQEGSVRSDGRAEALPHDSAVVCPRRTDSRIWPGLCTCLHSANSRLE